MPLQHPLMRPQRSQGSWTKSKPLQRLAFLAIGIATLLFFLYSDISFHTSSFLPDRQQDTERSNRGLWGVTKSDIAKGRNPRRSSKPRAAFVVLIRERQLSEILPTMRDIQWAFNDDHSYDYVFLSETVFTPWFKDHINDFLSKRPFPPKASFGLISKEDWGIPAHIDMEKAKRRWANRMSLAIPYAKSTSYRQMCRYMSGPVYQHPLLKDLDYYWRLEPETKHLCTLKSFWRQAEGKELEWVERDPFRYMRGEHGAEKWHCSDVDHKIAILDNNKKYAWVMTMSEYRSTVMSLMASINKWKGANPSMLAKNDSFSFVSNDGLGYNLCHYWSNFEIIDLSFTRSQAYTSYFSALDKAGGFFYERWGDAPVRSIAASMMLNSSEVWQVDYAGYFHPPISQCPRTLDPGQICACDSHDNIDYSIPMVSCRAKADKINGVDTNAVVHAINLQNDIIENFKEGEQPYAIPPPRLVSSPIV